MEDGLDLVARPFQRVAGRLGWSESDVLARLAALVASGVVSRFGLVLRHRHFGYGANAMVVWDAPDGRLQEIAQRFAARDFVTLCYERPRREGWRYNLFTMIHGREREAALAHVEELVASAADIRDHAVLFSRVVASGSAARDCRRREVAMIDETDRRIVNALQEGFPLVPRPFAAKAAELGVSEGGADLARSAPARRRDGDALRPVP